MPKLQIISDAAIARAGALIRSGELVAFPTETVYGLGADATNGEAIARVYAAKGRPSFNPLIVHVPNLEQAQRIAVIDGPLLACAEAFWPGALTLVAERRAGGRISDLATAGLRTVAVRVPSHGAAVEFIRAADRPIVAPSANRSGHVSATRPEHVADDLGDAVAMILDGGPTAIGVESTIIGQNTHGELTLLRAGAITGEAISAATGLRLVAPRHHANDTAPNAPGQLTSHYAPSASVRLDAMTIDVDEALLAFGSVPFPQPAITRNLSARGDLIEAAANLFTFMRELDAQGARRVAVMPIPNTGLGIAINDRLRRAAAPRPAS